MNFLTLLAVVFTSNTKHVRIFHSFIHFTFTYLHGTYFGMNIVIYTSIFFLLHLRLFFGYFKVSECYKSHTCKLCTWLILCFSPKSMLDILFALFRFFYDFFIRCWKSIYIYICQVLTAYNLFVSSCIWVQEITSNSSVRRIGFSFFYRRQFCPFYNNASIRHSSIWVI